MLFWIAKYVIFNIMYIPIVVVFRDMLFSSSISDAVLIGVILAGQIALLIYDRAYEYAQVCVWGKIRGRIMS